LKSLAFEQLAKKIALFEECMKAGRKARLSEAQTRLEFIDPLFRALGWDVGNDQALNQFDREVLVEESIETEDTITKTHPDYTFKISGVRQFFVEAKRPAVDVKASLDASFQLRRYAWSAQLAISALTDFEEISLYDCTIPPKPKDDARTARQFYKTYDRYLDEWDDLYAVLSRDAVRAGALQELARPENAREPFDRAFLQDLDRWRLTLAQAIQSHNDLGIDTLNWATQVILDRIVFLRVAEARGVKPARATSLSDLLLLPSPIYPRLLTVFNEADDRYNSGLFHFRHERGRHGSPDGITPDLAIPDHPLKSIIEGLYPPKSPYAFATVPADILGSVYERFLGNTISIGPSGKVKIEPKPEIRKQGGVFYTPSNVVRYMVRTAIGQWIEAHKLDQLRSIRICDPACGSGAFLVAAYEFILEANIRRYLQRKDTTEKHLIDHGDRIYSLNISEKKRILQECIFGIDIDPAAVEITKLSLLLAALEGETRESVDRQLSLFSDRPLPDLSENILCNNSLLESADLDLTDLQFIDQLRPLDWDASPVTGPGFDVLLGNPPYVFGEWHHPVQLRAVRSRLRAIRQIDLYHAFLDLVIRKRRPDGYWSLIVPDPVLARDDTEHLRSLMLSSGDLQASHVGCVFADAAVSCVVLTQGPLKKRHIEVHSPPTFDSSYKAERKLPFAAIEGLPDKGFRLSLDENELRLLGKLRARPGTIEDWLVSLSRGEEFGKKDLGQAGVGMEPCIVGEDVEPFQLRQPRYHIPKQAIGKSRSNYSAPKAVTIKTGLRPKTAIDRVGYVTLQSVYNLHAKPPATVELIAAILNSSLAGWFIRAMYTSHKKLFPQMNQRHLLEIPLPDQGKESDIVDTVRALEACQTGSQREFLIRKLDSIVSTAYGLTEAERMFILK
jgi:hypothetical protein